MLTNPKQKFWVPFKYENLPSYCFGCGRLGQVLRQCVIVDSKVKELAEDDYPFSIALKV